MKKTIPFILIFLISCSSSTKEKKEKELRHGLSIATIDEVAERVQKAVEPQIGAGKTTGAVIGIYLQGKSKFIFLGETKKGKKTAPNENTFFEIGSLTKTFTALLMAQEIELKKVKETDRISSIQKKWAHQKNSDITLIDLVTHRSGLPKLPCNLNVKNPDQPYADYDEKNLIDFLMDDRLKAHPECVIEPHPTNKVNDSNAGFGILGYILALKEKSNYFDLLKKKILTPLNLEETTDKISTENLPRVAQGYNEKGAPVSMWKRKVLMGNGALRSTAAELIVYAQSYLHPETTPIGPALQRTMQLQFNNGQAGNKIAYSWFINPNGSFWHNGMTGGFSSYMKIYPKRDFAIFYLSNSARDLKCVPEAASDQPCTVNE